MKPQGPRTRYRDPAKIHAAVDPILNQHGVTPLIRVTLQESPQETDRQDHRGRPGPDTRYIKHVELRFDLLYDIDHQQMSDAERGDGTFPLVTNDRTLSELDLLHAYKRQPLIDIFDSVQRHEIHPSGTTPAVTVTELMRLPRQLLRLLRIPASDYGRYYGR